MEKNETDIQFLSRLCSEFERRIAALENAKVEEKFTSTNTGSPKLPLNYLEVETKLNAKSSTKFEYSHYEQGVKDCYELLEKQLRAGA